MSDLYWLTDEYMARLEPYFPKSAGGMRQQSMDLTRPSTIAGSGGVRRRVRSENGRPVKHPDRKQHRHDHATYLKAHRTASSLRVKRGTWTTDRSHEGGTNTKLHAVTDANGRPISLFVTAGLVSDYTGASALLDGLPRAQWQLGDRGYDDLSAIELTVTVLFCP